MRAISPILLSPNQWNADWRLGPKAFLPRRHGLPNTQDEDLYDLAALSFRITTSKSKGERSENFHILKIV